MIYWIEMDTKYEWGWGGVVCINQVEEVLRGGQEAIATFATYYYYYYIMHRFDTVQYSTVQYSLKCRKAEIKSTDKLLCTGVYSCACIHERKE